VFHRLLSAELPSLAALIEMNRHTDCFHALNAEIGDSLPSNPESIAPTADTLSAVPGPVQPKLLPSSIVPIRSPSFLNICSDAYSQLRSRRSRLVVQRPNRKRDSRVTGSAIVGCCETIAPLISSNAEGNHSTCERTHHNTVDKRCCRYSDRPCRSQRIVEFDDAA
jgi:hypothetical protein